MEFLQMLMNFENLLFIQKVFISCLFLGVILPLISVLLGGVADGIDFDLGIDLHIPVGTLLPLKPASIMLFLVVFGSTGLYLIQHFETTYAVFVAFMLGYAAAGLLFKFLLYPMMDNDETSKAFVITECIGKTATVSTRIQPESMGSVTIETKQGGVSYVARLQEGDRSVLEVGQKVEILSINPEKTVLTVVKHYFL